MMYLPKAIDAGFEFIVNRENLEGADKKELALHCISYAHCLDKKQLKEFLGLSTLSDDVIGFALEVK